MIGWNFPPNNDGLAAGANDGAIDAFAGKRLSSVVREVIQNSLDAKKYDDRPVNLHFSKQTLKTDKFSGFSSIDIHLKKSRDMAEKQGLPDVMEFYEHGINKVSQAENVDLFCIHDFNTKGLTGPLNEPYGPWFAITKGAGISQKSTIGSLGSFGHGSKAPFAFSDTHSAFYYTKIETDNKIEERFQGKSILQTHENPNQPGIYTQGTGFFGHIKGNKPLLNDEIPSWARSFRSRVTPETGTSIYLPYTSYDFDLYPETKITVVANFFYAIMSGELEVTIGEEKIHKDNLIDTYEDCSKLLESEQDEIDVEHIKECFETAKTIIDHTHHNAQEIANFGKILWWMRLNEDVNSRAVGISRSSGMLVTRKPIQLERFKGVKNFDLFICVQGAKGSELLKTLENPTHDNFEFDRIKIGSTKKEAQRRYKLFVNKVREVVNKYAALENSEEESLESLSFLFNEVNDEISNSDERTERSRDLKLLPASFNRPSKSNYSAGSELEFIEDNFARSHNNGRRNTSTNNGSLLGDSGKIKLEGTPSNESTKDRSQTFSVSNLRVNHSNENSKMAKIFFDSDVSGDFNLSIYAVGEHGSEAMQLVVNSVETSALKVSVEAGRRHSLEVGFVNFANSFVLEAKLNEI
ncbi:hypothetical protein OAT86_01140 [Planktomarina sp.]|nr:hypothetical protein [Planktomarina temperata]MDC3221847.1 hypothetical protein [Planktomarina sp.]